jgi:hypothetical protein
LFLLCLWSLAEVCCVIFDVVCCIFAVVVAAGWMLVDLAALCFDEVWGLPSEWLLVAAVAFAVDVGCCPGAYLLPSVAPESGDKVSCP